MSHIKEIASRINVTAAPKSDYSETLNGKEIRFYSTGVYLITGSVFFMNESDTGDLHDATSTGDEDLYKDLPSAVKKCDGVITGYSVNEGAGGFAFTGQVKPYKDCSSYEDFLRLLPKLPSFAGFKFKAYSDTLFLYSKGSNHIVITLDND